MIYRRVNIILIIKTKYLPLALVSYLDSMIISFGNKDTEKLYCGDRITKLAFELQKIGLRKLIMLDQSQDIKDLIIPPSNRLEKLKGEMSGFYSIRINNRWRIIFKWIDNNAYNVEIIDYH